MTDSYTGTQQSGMQQFAYAHGSNSAIEWTAWLRTFETFMRACPTQPDQQMDISSKLLHYAGPKVQQVYASFGEEPTEEKSQFGPLVDGYVVKQTKYENMVEKLNEFFAPKRNPFFQRSVFRKMKQAKGKTVYTETGNMV